VTCDQQLHPELIRPALAIQVTIRFASFQGDDGAQMAIAQEVTQLMRQSRAYLLIVHAIHQAARYKDMSVWPGVGPYRLHVQDSHRNALPRALRQNPLREPIDPKLPRVSQFASVLSNPSRMAVLCDAAAPDRQSDRANHYHPAKKSDPHANRTQTAYQ
jgi:hypothetical protein